MNVTDPTYDSSLGLHILLALSNIYKATSGLRNRPKSSPSNHGSSRSICASQKGLKNRMVRILRSSSMESLNSPGSPGTNRRKWIYWLYTLAKLFRLYMYKCES